jgi:hypothetical protein
VLNVESVSRGLREGKKADIDDDGRHAVLSKHLACSGYAAGMIVQDIPNGPGFRKLTADS